MYSKLLLLLTTLVLATTLWTSCDDEQDAPRPPRPPHYNVGSIQIVTGVPNDTLYFAPGDSVSTTVTVIVTNRQGLAYPGVPVDLVLANATVGALEFTDSSLVDTTNQLGRVLAAYRCDGIAHDQIIAATAGDITAQRILVIREEGHIDPNTILLTATPTLLEADLNGFAQTRIDLTVRNESNIGIPNINALFSATGGRINFPPPTDSSGHTSFFWTFDNVFGEFWLTARAGAKRDSVMVRVQEAPDLYSLTVTAEPTFLLIDSSEEVHSQVTITLLDGFGQGRPNALVNISASGGIIPELPLTNANGQIQFNWAFRGFGDYYLFAYYPEWGLRDSVTVSISLRVHESPQVNIYTIPATLRVDSNTVGEAFIVVTALDENGILLPNVTPTLTVEVGEFDPPPPTDANGQSQTTWRFFNNFGAFQVTTSIEYNGQTATDSTLINVLYGP